MADIGYMETWNNIGDTVDKFKEYQRKSFWIISLYMLAVTAGVCAGLFYGLDRVVTVLSALPEKERMLENMLQITARVQADFVGWVLPAVAGVMLVSGWVLWLVLRFGMAPVFRDFSGVEPLKKPAVTTGKKDFLDQKLEQDRRQRLFLHTLSVLQRKGRLLDFFDEDLKRYSDEQIGAAVRSIQEDCKQAVKKYIDPRPVVDADEGQPITIQPGFDMNAITLVGNVAGDPPFEGTIRHRGWKAGKKEIPKLADIPDPAVITPAEIEVGVGT